jgi:hypothetical protein
MAHTIIFVAAKGARAIPTFSSGYLSGEAEVTIMPSQRYLVRKITKNHKGGYDIEVVGLPLPKTMPKMKGEALHERG